VDTVPRAALFGALGFLVAGGIFATLEAALTSLPEPLARKERRFARWVEHRGRVRATLWAALTLCRLGTGIFVYDLAISIVGSRAYGLGVLVAAFAAMVVLEMGARFAGRTSPEGLSAAGLVFLRPFELILTPIASPLEALLPGLRGPASEADETVEEVKQFLEEGGAAANKEGEELIENILEFRDTTAKEVMVPRTQVVSVAAETPLVELVGLVEDELHSRIPVYKGRTDNVIGILHVKDLLPFLQTRPPDGWTVESIVRGPVLFVPESQPLSRLLKDMRKRGAHLAIVVDEFGGTSGVVTLEDVLEEIVGEIRDEYDAAEEAPIVKVDERTFLADASVSIYDLGEALGKSLPREGDYESLGGFLTARAGRVPEIGSTLKWDGLTFTVRAADEKRVEKVEIRMERRPE
jgi:CBS domain containing-hemolysin-like protein